jgi:hypothetical protein
LVRNQNDMQLGRPINMKSGREIEFKPTHNILAECGLPFIAELKRRLEEQLNAKLGCLLRGGYLVESYRRKAALKHKRGPSD